MAENINISELVPDDMNFNNGTLKGRALLDKSFQKFGAGRSILVDKNNRIIAGNKSAISASARGIREVRIIETNGDELVAVKRTDIDLSSAEGREMALADNMTSKINFKLDYNVIMQAVQDVQLDPEVWKVDLNGLKREETKARQFKDEVDTYAEKKLVFKGHSIDMTDDEYEKLVELTEEYYDDHGELTGFVANLLN